MTIWTWLDIGVIVCTVINVTVIVRSWMHHRRPLPPLTPGSEATVAELTRRNLWQADQIEKLSRQLWDAKSEVLMLQNRLEQLGVGKDGRGDD